MQTTKSWQTGLTVWITIVIVSFAFTATAMNAAAEEATYYLGQKTSSSWIRGISK
jgi:hypothetical protein